MIKFVFFVVCSYVFCSFWLRTKFSFESYHLFCFDFVDNFVEIFWRFRVERFSNIFDVANIDDDENFEKRSLINFFEKIVVFFDVCKWINKFINFCYWFCVNFQFRTYHLCDDYDRYKIENKTHFLMFIIIIAIFFVLQFFLNAMIFSIFSSVKCDVEFVRTIVNDRKSTFKINRYCQKIE